MIEQHEIEAAEEDVEFWRSLLVRADEERWESVLGKVIDAEGAPKGRLQELLDDATASGDALEKAERDLEHAVAEVKKHIKAEVSEAEETLRNRHVDARLDRLIAGEER